MSILTKFLEERRKRRTNRNTEWDRLRKLADLFLSKTQKSLLKEDGLDRYQWTVLRIIYYCLFSKRKLIGHYVQSIRTALKTRIGISSDPPA